MSCNDKMLTISCLHSRRNPSSPGLPDNNDIRERGRERGHLPFVGLASKWQQQSGVWTGQSHKPGTWSRSLMWVHDPTKTVFWLLYQAHQQATELEVEQPELKSLLIWDAGMAGGSIKHCTTMPPSWTMWSGSHPHITLATDSWVKTAIFPRSLSQT